MQRRQLASKHTWLVTAVKAAAITEPVSKCDREERLQTICQQMAWNIFIFRNSKTRGFDFSKKWTYTTCTICTVCACRYMHILMLGKRYHAYLNRCTEIKQIAKHKSILQENYFYHRSFSSLLYISNRSPASWLPCLHTEHWATTLSIFCIHQTQIHMEQCVHIHIHTSEPPDMQMIYGNRIKSD